MSGLSKSQVSRLCEEIDQRVKAFLDRPIEGDWPYLWIDATCLKVRQAGARQRTTWAAISRKVPRRSMIGSAWKSGQRGSLLCRIRREGAAFAGTLAAMPWPQPTRPPILRRPVWASPAMVVREGERAECRSKPEDRPRSSGHGRTPKPL
jgi:hypothetical protein